MEIRPTKLASKFPSARIPLTGVWTVAFAVGMLFLGVVSALLANSVFDEYHKNTLSDFPQASVTRFIFKTQSLVNASDAACINAVHVRTASAIDRCADSVDEIMLQIREAESHSPQRDDFLQNLLALKEAAKAREELTKNISRRSTLGESEAKLLPLLQNSREFAQIVSAVDSGVLLDVAEQKDRTRTEGMVLRVTLLVIIGASALGAVALVFFWHKYRRARTLAEEAKAESEAARLKVIHSARLSAVGEMAGSIAHEIASPLTVISMQAQHLISMAHESGTLPSEDIVSSCERIERTVGRISKTVKSLRKMSRAAKPSPFERTLLVKVVTEVLDISGEKLKKNGIDLRLKVDENLAVMGRELELSQVLLNLLNNSVDAIVDKDEKWLSIEVGSVEKSGKTVVQIAVTDSGSGIPSHMVARIMEPFFTTKDAEHGTGLGLSISNEIVLAHGGVLYVDEACRNTRFVVEIPWVGREPSAIPA